jgi:hypothetical protein
VTLETAAPPTVPATVAVMSRDSALMAALTDEPVSTSELYDRVGYLTLARLGLIPYASFRAELGRLAATGTVECQTAPDGSTLWRHPPGSRTL